MKRLGVVAAFVIVAGPLVTMAAGRKPAPAPKPAPTVIDLEIVGDEQASGKATLTILKTDATFEPFGGAIIKVSAKLTVSCANLTPGATYQTPVGTFTANAEGAGSANGRVVFSFFSNPYLEEILAYTIDVVRLDPNGNSVTVLTGEYWW